MNTEKAFKIGLAFAKGLRADKYKMAMDDWVTMKDKNGENYHVDLAGGNPNKINSFKESFHKANTISELTSLFNEVKEFVHNNPDIKNISEFQQLRIKISKERQKLRGEETNKSSSGTSVRGYQKAVELHTNNKKLASEMDAHEKEFKKATTMQELDSLLNDVRKQIKKYEDNDNIVRYKALRSKIVQKRIDLRKKEQANK